MYFPSFAELLVMDGHGPYVWACYVAVLMVYSGLCLWTIKEHSRASRRFRPYAKTKKSNIL